VSLAQPATWQGVRAEVQRRIRTHQWAPGDPIPNEADLAVEFGCARATVNRALRDLAQAGVLERKRKAGTRVAVNPAGRAVLRIPLIRDEIAEAGLAYGYRLLGSRTACPPDPVRDRLDLAPGTQALHLTALHSGDGAPFVAEDRWINTATVPDASRADFTVQSANEWLVRAMPFAEGRIEISVVAAGSEMAAIFGCDPGAGLLRVERQTWRDGRQITVVALTYRPGHRLVSQL